MRRTHWLTFVARLTVAACFILCADIHAAEESPLQYAAYPSIREFGVTSTNSAAANKSALVLMDLFTFGVYGGVYLGPVTYGQLSSFNLDCVTVGIHKLGDGTFNRNWQIAQGSIIANTG